VTDLVLLQARQLNFVCRKNEQGNWQILPARSRDRWQLNFVEDRWVLSIDGIPQIWLSVQDAIKFLQDRARLS
jgi:hypothetical protein